jgi:hypothetical protein
MSFWTLEFTPPIRYRPKMVMPKGKENHKKTAWEIASQVQNIKIQDIRLACTESESYLANSAVQP